MNCEKFILVREVRFTLLYKTCNFTISGETSPTYVRRRICYPKELSSIPVVDFEFSLILRKLCSIPEFGIQQVIFVLVLLAPLFLALSYDRFKISTVTLLLENDLCYKGRFSLSISVLKFCFTLSQ